MSINIISLVAFSVWDCLVMVGRGLFWERALTVLESVVKELDVGECSEPMELHEVAERAGIGSNRLRAPDIISIDAPDYLPDALRVNTLYVVRLGQWHSGRAMFTLCKASERYAEETISVDDICSVPRLPVEPVEVPEWLATIARVVNAEALAFMVASILVEALAQGERVYVLPSLRIGRIRFSFKPSSNSRMYEYHGQVEVDAALGRSFIFALEAKSFTRRRAVFKYKIAFSAQALAETTGREVHPLLSTIREEGEMKSVTVALLSPPARPGHPYTINDMKPYARLDLTLSFQ